MRDWIAQENALTRKVLDGSPKRAAIFAELSSLLGKAVVSHVGTYDMLRVELPPNGDSTSPSSAR